MEQKLMKKGWKIELLKNSCKVFDDGNWIESKDQSPSGIRLVQTGNIGFGFFKDKEDKSRFISEDTFVRLKCTEILPGDLLVSRLPDPVGKSCVIPDLKIKMITGVDCTIIRTKDFLKPEFLRYFQMSNSYLKDVDARVTGTTRSRISRKNLGLVEIPIPPLEEQRTIVAKLDQAFASIDQAKANIEKNIANAKELFQSKLNQIFSQKGEGWEEKKLGEVVQLTNGRNQKEVLDVNGEYPILGSAGNIMGYANNFLCEQGTVIIGRKGNISKPLFIDFKFWNVDTAFGLFPKNKLMHPKFNYYLCLNIDFASLDKGTTIPSLVKSDLIQIEVSYPKLLETQQQIVTQLDQLQEQTNLLVTKYQQKLANLEELKKSILEKAFKGELSTTVIEKV